MFKFYHRLLNYIGKWPCDRNMETIQIFDEIQGTGLDIGHDGEYNFKNGNVIRLNIYDGEKIDVVYDGKKIPFHDGKFDKLLLRCVLEHVADPISILEEATRVLKLNGKLVLEVPFINPVHAAPNDYFRYTPDGLKELIKDKNLKITRIFYTQDQNYAIRWLLWQRLKKNEQISTKYLIKMIVLKFFINPLMFRSTIPDENNFSQFGFILKKTS